MAGLYFHIPFCKRICAYCDFFKSADLRSMEPVRQAMHRELEAQRSFIGDHHIRTIYFGGGTPSLYAPTALQEFADHAAELFDCSQVEEVTVEVNPDDINAQYIRELRTTAVNRLSIGIQSFNDAELRFMNRRHTSAEALDAVRLAQDAGFDNITIDLIFGVKGFGDQTLARNIEQALSLGVQHISAYHLTIEPDTAFARRVARGEFAAVDEDVSEREYLTLHNTLTGAGFDHYEVSNYALEGYQARHNSAYWSGDEYLGIGAGAHSFNGMRRQWAVASVEQFIAGGDIYTDELLTEIDHYNEYVMTALRTRRGVSIEEMKSRFSQPAVEQFLHNLQPYIASGEVVVEGSRVAIPPEKMLRSDAIIGALFEVNSTD